MNGKPKGVAIAGEIGGKTRIPSKRPITPDAPVSDDAVTGRFERPGWPENEVTVIGAPILPGLVREAQGALIYDSKYQASIGNGSTMEWVAMPPGSGLESLAGKDYKSPEEFMQKVHALRHPAPSTARPLNLKVPQVLSASGKPVRVPSMDGAAAAAANRMIEGASGTAGVSAFSASGGSIGVEVPVIRVPVPVAIP
jgi:hypothetical protein